MLSPPFIMGLSMRGGGMLRQLALNLRQAPKRIQEMAAKEIQTEIEKAIDKGFTSKTDPYGSRWQPPKDGGPTMERTGKLRRGFVVETVSNGMGISLRITNSADYAKWLQRGTAKMEPRRMVPDRALPPGWKEIFTKAYDRAIATWYATTK